MVLHTEERVGTDHVGEVGRGTFVALQNKL